tara:strand:- start:1659 stop:1808 length:150 start_codon:yes stop_codon:yes gene_type:complete
MYTDKFGWDQYVEFDDFLMEKINHAQLKMRRRLRQLQLLEIEFYTASGY